MSKYTIQDLIDIDRKEETKSSKIELKIYSKKTNLLEIITSGIICGAGGFALGEGINKEYGGVIGGISGALIGGYLGYQIQKKRQEL